MAKLRPEIVKVYDEEPGNLHYPMSSSWLRKNTQQKSGLNDGQSGHRKPDTRPSPICDFETVVMNFGSSYLDSDDSKALFDEPFTPIKFCSDYFHEDRLLDGANRVHHTDIITTFEDKYHSSDVMKLSSQQDMMKEFLKNKLFDC